MATSPSTSPKTSTSHNGTPPFALELHQTATKRPNTTNHTSALALPDPDAKQSTEAKKSPSTQFSQPLVFVEHVYRAARQKTSTDDDDDDAAPRAGAHGSGMVAN